MPRQVTPPKALTDLNQANIGIEYKEVEANRQAVRTRGSSTSLEWSTGRPNTPPKALTDLNQANIGIEYKEVESNRLAVRTRGSSTSRDWSTGRPNTAPKAISDLQGHMGADAKEFEHVVEAKKRGQIGEFGTGRSITPPRAITELTSHLSYDAKGNEHIRTAARTRLRELGAQRPITPPESITKASFKDDGQDLISIQMKAAQATAREARLSTPSKARDPAFHDRVRKELNKELTA